MMRILKPNFWKFVLATALFYGSSMLWRIYVISRISDTFPHGFPLHFYLGWGPCQPGEICSEFNWLYLVLDLMIWYAVSAFMMDRIQKKQKPE